MIFHAVSVVLGGVLLASPAGAASPAEPGQLDRITFVRKAAGQAPETRQRQLELEGATYKYRVFVPPGHSSAKFWPVVLYLHGARDRGSDDRRPTERGLGPAIAAAPQRFPCVVVFPQIPRNRVWEDPAMQALALQALDKSIAEFSGDPKRVAGVGISAGASGLWTLASKNPGRFAALALVSGNLAPGGIAKPDAAAWSAVARRIGATPVWAFHGVKDPIVSVATAREQAGALKKAGVDLKLTEYPGVDHEAWDKAFAEPSLPGWLLGQTPGSRRDSSAAGGR